MGLLHFKAKSRSAAAVGEADETELLAKELGFLPARFRRRGVIAIRVVDENREIQLFPSHIDEPVFRNSGAMVAFSQQYRVLVHRTRADNFEQPIGSSFKLDP